MAKKTRVFHENISVKGIVANGVIGNSTQVLSSNGTSTYWADSDTGPMGYTGSQGTTGFVGSKGDIGFTGSQGSIGATGFVGSQGATGFVGSKGDIGFTGSQGIIGFTGSLGGTGFVGSLGYTGSQGVPGVTSFGDGAVGTPSIYFTSDPDTGLYRSTTDELSITTGAALRARFGTTSSIYGDLGVNGALAASGNITEAGSRVWTAATFNPATKANVSGQVFTGAIGSPGARITGTAIPAGSAGGGLELLYNANKSFIQSYDRTTIGYIPMDVAASIITLISYGGTTQLQGNVNVSNNFTVAGTATVTGNVSGLNASFRDVTANRGDSTGRYYFAGGTPYLSWNGSRFEFVGGELIAPAIRSPIFVSSNPEGVRLANATPYMSFYNAAETTRFGYMQHDGTNITLANDQAGYVSLAHASGNWIRANGAGGWINNSLLIGTAISAPLARLHIAAGHSDSQIRLYSTGGGTSDGAGGFTDDCNMDIWASHPNVAYANGGIGYNINFYRYNGKRKSTQGAACWEFQSDGVVELYNASTAEGTLTKKISIDQNGQFGINTIPSFKLDVRGNNNNAAANVARFYQYNAANSDYHGYQVAIDPTNNWVYHYSTGTNTGGHIWGSSTERMRLTSDGNLGIGAAPSYPFHLYRNYNDSVLATVESGSTSGSFNYAGFNAVAGGGYTGSLITWGTGGLRVGQTWCAAGGNNPLILGTNDAARIWIEGGGKVGINTSAPQAQLHVTGDVWVRPADNSTYLRFHTDGSIPGISFCNQSSMRWLYNDVTEVMTLNNSGDLRAHGNITSRKGSDGFLTMTGGGASNTGYLAFFGADAARDGYIGFATTSGALQYVSENGGGHYFGGGDLTCTGNITAYFSDERLKTRVRSIEHATYKVLYLNGFYYTENKLAQSFGYKGDKLHVGLSAQEVNDVLPEAVSLAPFDRETLEDGTVVSKSGENYMTVDYARLVPLLIESIKELHERINILENKNRKLN